MEFESLYYIILENSEYICFILHTLYIRIFLYVTLYMNIKIILG